MAFEVSNDSLGSKIPQKDTPITQTCCGESTRPIEASNYRPRVECSPHRGWQILRLEWVWNLHQLVAEKQFLRICQASLNRETFINGFEVDSCKGTLDEPLVVANYCNLFIIREFSMTETICKLSELHQTLSNCTVKLQLPGSFRIPLAPFRDTGEG
jgi:hypothetical protein